MPIHLVEEYPIPFDKDEIVKMQEEQVGEPYGLCPEDGIIKSVDEFHDRYITEMVRTDEWSVFKNGWNGWGYVYFWNYQLSYGFKVDDDWETICPFIRMMDSFTQQYDSSDFEPNMYSWELP